MQNDVLRNSIVPWQDKGRFYQFFIESDGSSPTLTISGIDGATVSGTSLKLPKEFFPTEYFMRVHNVECAAAQQCQKKATFNANATTSLSIPAASCYDYMELFVFGYYEW